MTLCKLCDGITLDGLTEDKRTFNGPDPCGYLHHPSLQALAESGKTCQGCQLIKRALQDNKGIDPSSDTWLDKSLYIENKYGDDYEEDDVQIWLTSSIPGFHNICRILIRVGFKQERSFDGELDLCAAEGRVQINMI
jgi:hypothetical protein